MSDSTGQADIDKKALSFGYIRQFVNNASRLQSYIIPLEISELIYAFYGKCWLIFGVGRNECGELGLGHCFKVTNYTPLSRFSSLMHAPKHVYPQWKKFYIKTESNEIYYAGFDYLSNQFTSQFTRLTLPSSSAQIDIALISEGLQAAHTFVIAQDLQHWDDDFWLFALGNNYQGQFGTGWKQRKYDDVKITNVTLTTGCYLSGGVANIKQIKCGESHSIFLTKNGLVFTVGSNTRSQCGEESIDNDQVYYPKWIHFPRNALIQDVCCGSNHNLCVSTEHQLFVFGCNEYGQISPKWRATDNEEDELNEEQTDTLQDEDAAPPMLLPHRDQVITPRLHPYFAQQKEIKIRLIDCGANHSLCIDFEGGLWMFGDNRCGQIGCNQDVEYVDVPFLMQSHKHLNEMRFKYGSAGYSHTALLSTKEPQQFIYVFGCNLHRECSAVEKCRYMTAPYVLTKREIFGEDQSQYRIQHVIAARCSTLIMCEK